MIVSAPSKNISIGSRSVGLLLRQRREREKETSFTTGTGTLLLSRERETAENDVWLLCQYTEARFYFLFSFLRKLKGKSHCDIFTLMCNW